MSIFHICCFCFCKSIIRMQNKCELEGGNQDNKNLCKRKNMKKVHHSVSFWRSTCLFFLLLLCCTWTDWCLAEHHLEVSEITDDLSSPLTRQLSLSPQARQFDGGFTVAVDSLVDNGWWEVDMFLPLTAFFSKVSSQSTDRLFLRFVDMSTVVKFSTKYRSSTNVANELILHSQNRSSSQPKNSLNLDMEILHATTRTNLRGRQLTASKQPHNKQHKPSHSTKSNPSHEYHKPQTSWFYSNVQYFSLLLRISLLFNEH